MATKIEYIDLLPVEIAHIERPLVAEFVFDEVSPDVQVIDEQRYWDYAAVIAHKAVESLLQSAWLN